MSLTTADEILDLWARNETPEAKVERRAIEALKKDIQTAQDSIQDAVSRYRKAKLRTCSKAKANSEDIFRPLEEYDSQVDIQNAYGYEMITETEYDRLMELWELRAQSVQSANLSTSAPDWKPKCWKKANGTSFVSSERLNTPVRSIMPQV